MSLHRYVLHTPHSTPTHGVSDVEQILLARGLEDVVDHGRYIEHAHLVPAADDKGADQSGQ